MDQAITQKIKEAIDRSQQIGILVAKNPTIDSMGAGLSLYLTLREMGKSVSVASPSEPLVELTSLVGIDQVQANLSSGGGDLVVSFPYKEGEIEKVSYTVENGFLNIVVKASEEGLSFGEQDVKYSQGNGEVDLLFVIGAKSLVDLGVTYNPETLKNATVINIDNSQDNTGFGDIVMVSPSASSISEQIAMLFASLNYDPDIDTAQNLLEGITFATESFQSPKTSATAFEMAGLLMRKGAIRIGAIPAAAPYVLPQAPQPFTPPMSVQQPLRQSVQQFPNRPQMQRPQQQAEKHLEQIREQMQQPQNVSQQEATEPPSDWLTPKVYKGSTSV